MMMSAATGPNRGSAQAESTVAIVMIALAAAVALISIALTFRTYMPCPWVDGWEVISDIADGARPWSWHWLWSQEYHEHRMAIPRFLIWLDWAAFGGRNISLFVEIYLVQALHWASVCYALERLTGYPKLLKRTLEALFAFCLFHPNQAQNLTLSIAIASLVSFAIGTVALLIIAFSEKVPARYRTLSLIGVVCAPLVAASSSAGGLLIGPVLVGLAGIKRLPGKVALPLAASSLFTFLLYFYGYRTPPDHPSPLHALSHPIDIFRYVYVFLGASWPLFSPVYLSLVFSAAWIALKTIRRESISSFEWFCIAECALMLATAVSEACARLQYGVEQAANSRYQTPALIYWACLLSLVLIAAWGHLLTRFSAQLLVLLIAASSVPFIPGVWSAFVNQADQNRRACIGAMSSRQDASEAKWLSDIETFNKEIGIQPHAAERGVALLRKKWTY